MMILWQIEALLLFNYLQALGVLLHISEKIKPEKE
jgi:hypothetical protein